MYTHRHFLVKPLALAALGALGLAGTGAIRPLGAQQLPTPAEAQRLLQTRPDLIAQLQARLKASGMSDTEVRQKLKSLGYSPTMLDAYLGGGKTDTVTATPEVLNAFKAMGLADSLEKPKPIAEV